MACCHLHMTSVRMPAGLLLQHSWLEIGFSISLTIAPQPCSSLIGNKCKLYLKDNDESLQILHESLDDSRSNFDFDSSESVNSYHSLRRNKKKKLKKKAREKQSN